jgi:long-subunit acyl-CoA synthetase (AMP-forming)
VCVIGDGWPYNVALVTLDPEGARAYARHCDVPHAGLARLARSRRIVEAVQLEVAAANARLPETEQIRRFVLLGEQWLPGGDELTPTLKPRRRPIAVKYAAMIEALYDGALGIEP